MASETARLVESCETVLAHLDRMLVELRPWGAASRGNLTGVMQWDGEMVRVMLRQLRVREPVLRTCRLEEWPDVLRELRTSLSEGRLWQ